jgi:hypothetical protein
MTARVRGALLHSLIKGELVSIDSFVYSLGTWLGLVETRNYTIVDDFTKQ